MMFVLRVIVFALGALAIGFMFGGLVFAAECACRRRERARAGEPTLAEYVAREEALWREALEQADEASMEELAQKLTSKGMAILDAERKKAS